jgi:3-isopropylmalate/(R)-2-methylmalate dehydratase small subunit
MEKKIKGRIWKFGDNINTDVITPGKYENLPMDEMSQYCLEPVDSDFAKNAKENDILVAGENFGCGSAREIAPTALKYLKVGAIIAKSYARTFFRNAIAIGLPVLISKDAASLCKPGDVLEIDLKQSKIKNLSTKTSIKIEPIDDDIFQILLKGGIFSTIE